MNNVNKFQLIDIYPCPLCRRGQLRQIVLMDAMGCNFCNHIFTANLEQQILTIADNQLPLSWRWHGNKWKNVRKEGVNIGLGYLILGTIIVLLPTFIIACSVYIFPPLPGSRLSWFPIFWIIATFIAHLTCLIWLILEYYQFPLGIYLRVINRRLRNSV